MTLTAAMASSHAYAFLDTTEWDNRRKGTQRNFERRYGWLPADRPEVALADAEADANNFRDLTESFAFFQNQMSEVDTLVIVGDDQDENFQDECQPQFAIHTGADFQMKRDGENITLQSHAELSKSMYRKLVEAEFDVAHCVTLPREQLIAHAHVPIIDMLDPKGQKRIVLVFVNAIHHPGPSPKRCIDFGRVLREAIEAIPAAGKVAMYASGGLSHFTAGYPWADYQGPHEVGFIDVDFDRHIVDVMQRADLDRLESLTSAELLAHGDVEFRQWLVLLGAIGKVKPEFLHYHPFFRAVTGMSAAFWRVQT